MSSFLALLIKKYAKLWLHIASLKMHRRHAHRKFQPKWVCMYIENYDRTLQLESCGHTSAGHALIIMHKNNASNIAPVSDKQFNFLIFDFYLDVSFRWINLPICHWKILSKSKVKWSIGLLKDMVVLGLFDNFLEFQIYSLLEKCKQKSRLRFSTFFLNFFLAKFSLYSLWPKVMSTSRPRFLLMCAFKILRQGLLYRWT